MKKQTLTLGSMILSLVLSGFLICSGILGTVVSADTIDYQPGQHSITISHQWHNDNAADRPTSIELDVYQSIDGNKNNDDALVTRVSLKAENNWRVVVPGLAEDYYYYAELVTPIAGYTTTNDQIVELDVPKDLDGLLWRDPDYYNHLGSANYFSAFIFNDFTVEGADVESGLAVGGNLKSATDFSLGLPASKDAQWGWFSPGYNVGLPVAPHSPRLLVGGAIDVPHGIHIIGGNLTMKDNTKIKLQTAFIKEWYYQGTGVYDSSIPPSEFVGVQYTRYLNDGYRNYTDIKEADASKINTFFDEAEESLKYLSQEYAMETTTGSTLVFDITPDANGNLLLEPQLPNGVTDYSGYDYLIYNVKVAHTDIINLPANEGQVWKNNIVIPDEFFGMVIINILPDAIDTINFVNSTTQINGLDYVPGTQESTAQGKFFELANGYSDQIMWNFPNSDMATVKLKAYGIIGSFLAPYSDIFASGGNINGTMVASSLKGDTGFEVHSSTFRGRGELGYNIDLNLSSTKNNEPKDFGKFSLMAIKTAIGKELSAEEFTFLIKEGDIVVAKGTNDQDGKITFDSIVYTEAGSHTYKVIEQTAKGNGWQMDKTVYSLRVDVDEHGLTVYPPDDDIIFTNKYEELPPETTGNNGDPLPKTGDEYNQIIPLIILVSGAGLLIVAKNRTKSN